VSAPRPLATRWIDHLERFLPVALAGRDPEGVHQVRVAARRLRVWLELGGHRALGGELRELSRALGPARDLVLIAPLQPLRAWYQQQRALEQQRVTAALAPEHTRALLQALRALAPPGGKRASRRLDAYAARVERSTRRLRAARKSKRFERAHRLRRDARALRFAQEWLGLDASTSAHVQESLGRVCDVMALRRLLQAWAAQTGHQIETEGLLEQLETAVIKSLRTQ
jgi:CHAD domain-containing protein